MKSEMIFFGFPSACDLGGRRRWKSPLDTKYAEPRTVIRFDMLNLLAAKGVA